MSHSIIASSNPIKVSKHNLCPICGKHDWCFSSVSSYSFSEGPNEDFVFVCCRRVIESQIQGEDGGFYIYDRTSSKGVHIYEDVMQRAHRYERMGIDDKVKSPTDYKVKVPKKKTILCENNVKDVDLIDKVYRALFDALVLEDYHKDYLRSEKWDEHLIEASMFRSLPPSGYDVYKIIQKKKSGTTLSDFEEMSLSLKNRSRKQIAQELFLKFGDLEGIPGFYLNHSNFNNSNYWDFSGKQGILMPMFNVEGKIFGLRIKLDDGGTYKWISSYYEKPIKESETEIVYDNPMKKGSKTSASVSYRFTDYQSPFLFVTEGEKKQNVVLIKKGIPCANVPGVESFRTMLSDLDALKERGIRYIIIGYDADKSSNTLVLRAELNLIQALLEGGFEIFIAEWSEVYGKGVDDVLLSGNDITYESLEQYLDKFDC